MTDQPLTEEPSKKKKRRRRKKKRKNPDVQEPTPPGSGKTNWKKLALDLGHKVNDLEAENAKLRALTDSEFGLREARKKDRLEYFARRMLNLQTCSRCREKIDKVYEAEVLYVIGGTLKTKKPKPEKKEDEQGE